MNILITIIISGMAVGYLTELIASLGERVFNPRIVKLILTLPLSYLACWLLGLVGFTLIVSGPAAAFFSLASLLLLNRPVTIQNTSNRRY
jgi:hypothetical protein